MVTEFDQSIRVALLISALCNTSSVQQKVMGKEEQIQKLEEKKRKKWLWNRRKENQEEMILLDSDDGKIKLSRIQLD